MSPASRLLPHVSCLTSSVSNLCEISRLLSYFSSLTSHFSQFFCMRVIDALSRIMSWVPSTSIVVAYFVWKTGSFTPPPPFSLTLRSLPLNPELGTRHMLFDASRLTRHRVMPFGPFYRCVTVVFLFTFIYASLPFNVTNHIFSNASKQFFSISQILIS